MTPESRYAGIEVTPDGRVRVAVVVPGNPPVCTVHPAPDAGRLAAQAAGMRDIAHAVARAIRGAEAVAVLALPGRPTAVQSGLWWLTVAALADAGVDPVPVPLGLVKRWATGSGCCSGDAVLAAVGRAHPASSVDDVARCAIPLMLAAMGCMASGRDSGWRGTKGRREIAVKLPGRVRRIA